jgi:hypothetical protein
MATPQVDFEQVCSAARSGFTAFELFCDFYGASPGSCHGPQDFIFFGRPW